MASPAPLPVHPALEPVAFLLGTWKGEGEGGYPTIDSFKYGEEIKFWHSGKPVMAYMQKTWKAASGEPMHAESGYLRARPDGTLEFVIAQSTGLAEVQKGAFDGDARSIRLESSVVGNASKVVSISREWKVEGGGDRLSYVVSMATTGQPLQPHLRASLQRVTT
eukprot:jgi/Mesen1/9737/ME000695S09047